jgi:predicted short-subunit dehydrogenase-like oxidoreductase (DUF2520 family)
VIGDGRMGRAVTAALRAVDAAVRGPLGRGATADGADVVLLAVPDSEIERAAASITPGPVVGHLSGATTLAPLAPHAAFGLHPLTTVSGPDADFADIPAAMAATGARSHAAARALAQALGLRPFEIDDADRAAYHAAASIASNFLVTLETFAAELAATAGVPRDALVPLVRATATNWETAGAAALTGPIVRGDDETVARQRAAVAERMPHRTALFDALTEATRELAARPGGLAA